MATPITSTGHDIGRGSARIHQTPPAVPDCRVDGDAHHGLRHPGAPEFQWPPDRYPLPAPAFVAWQSGQGALANVALDRALADDSKYSMALLLRQVINAGAPPSMARLPMTPEEVAASYEGAEKS
ncbi:MAG: DUF4192 family protein [Streptosporangiaceae bacterium]